ncbi:MAG: M28 family peptidase [Chloroflexota bacterium]
MPAKDEVMNMGKDEIVEEVRRHRDAYAARFNYDLDAIYRDLTAKERKSKRKMNEPTSQHPQVKQWLAHVSALSVDIGPRGPTCEGERKGAEYAKAQFEKIGFQPIWETFKSARSIFHPHLMGAILFLAAFAIFPLAGRLTAAIAAALTILALVSELQELGFQNNLFRMAVPKGDSQNVFAVIPPTGEHQRDIVLIGHVDTQFTPLIFRTTKWVKVYDKFTMLAFAAFIYQAILYTLAAFFGWGWAWPASLPAAGCALLLAAMCIEASSTPFTAGANDNATAVGMVLTLAAQFAQKPLQNTRIFAVITGCEEVQHYGAIDWFARHRAELKDPRAIILEMLGCAGPAWTTREGIIVPFKADPGLLCTVEDLSAAHPQWKAYPAKISGGNSELSDAVRFKVPAICLFGLKPDGEAPYWHQKQDTFDKMDSDVMERTWELAWALIQELNK